MIVIKPLFREALSPDLLRDFRHRQQITAQWEKRGGVWRIQETDLLREWSPEKRRWIPSYLKEQVERGGFALGAFHGPRLAGFCCVDGILLGDRSRYANLTMLFVDDAFQRQGIGRLLFHALKARAGEMRAEKLFISAVPSVDTIGFYFAMGCSDAEEIFPQFIDTEEDRYLECSLAERRPF